MRRSIETGLFQAAILIGAGLFSGALAGWIGLATNGEAVEDLASFGATFYLVLFLLLPGLLAFYTRVNRELGEAPEIYSSQGKKTLMLLVAAIVGSAGGSLFFALTATYVPAIFGDKDPVAMQEAVFPMIGWARVGLLAALTTAVALVLSFTGGDK